MCSSRFLFANNNGQFSIQLFHKGKHCFGSLQITAVHNPCCRTHPSRSWENQWWNEPCSISLTHCLYTPSHSFFSSGSGQQHQGERRPHGWLSWVGIAHPVTGCRPYPRMTYVTQEICCDIAYFIVSYCLVFHDLYYCIYDNVAQDTRSQKTLLPYVHSVNRGFTSSVLSLYKAHIWS